MGYLQQDQQSPEADEGAAEEHEKKRDDNM